MYIKDEEVVEILSQLRLNGEMPYIEVKDSLQDKEYIGKTISALSNSASYHNKEFGYFIWGIENRTWKCVGTDFNLECATQGKSGLIYPQIIGAFNYAPEIICEEKNVEGKRVYVVKIKNCENKPLAFNKVAYFRVGEANDELQDHPAVLKRIVNKSIDWSAQICDGATIHDLDTDAIAKARQGFIRKNPDLKEAEIMGWTDEIFLNKAKITINGKITRTAIILLGKAESEHFISPSVAKISWILKDQDGIEKDYQHFSCPFILAVDNVYAKIRNFRYRYIPDRTLFPEEIDAYDPETIREAINNCIAHQDYDLCGKINVVENEDGSLVFANVGSFIPETVENVIKADSPPEMYRNRFLAGAMVNVNMIDTIGSGIKRMFVSQKNKFFPLPEYDLTGNKVQVTIFGRILDIAYAKKLSQIPDLDLKTIIALDKVQKKKDLTKEEMNHLRSLRLIEGRSPNVYISSVVASETGEKADYMKRRGIDDEYAQKMILDCIKEFEGASRKDLDGILLDKLSDVLSQKQKKDKIKNLVQKLKMEKKIKLNSDRKWILFE